MSVLVIHGGAWNIPPQEKKAHEKALGKALAIGRKMLEEGKSALDAVEEAVFCMEESGVFDAGKGAVLNNEKKPQLDAAIMKGDLSLGSVAAVSTVCHPVRLARKVMEETPHCLLVGKGAEAFALQQGFKPCAFEEMVSTREKERYEQGLDKPFGTVGAVALDKEGKVAAATSTGGTFKKMAGRVGDSPLVGCGTYADNETGASSCTGHGESFMKIVAAKSACDLLATEETAQAAAEKVVNRVLERTGGKGGIILLRKDGDFGIAFSTPAMARGVWKSGMKEPVVEV